MNNNILKMTNHSKTGQLSTELLIVLSVFLLLFLSLFAFASDHFAVFSQKKVQLSAKIIAQDLSLQIHSLLLAGSGTSLTLSYPQKLDNGAEYFLQIFPSSRLLQISWLNSGKMKHYAVPLTTSSFQGNLTNMTSPLHLSNLQGQIIVR